VRTSKPKLLGPLKREALKRALRRLQALGELEKVLKVSLLVFGYAFELVGAPFGPLFLVAG
jgi:hypothetical protein